MATRQTAIIPNYLHSNVALPITTETRNAGYTTDAVITNMFVETIGNKKVLAKRPGSSLLGIYPNTVGTYTTRGLFEWQNIAFIFVNEKVYRADTGSSIIKLTTSSGNIGWCECTHEGAPYMFLTDGVDGYIISESIVVTKITDASWILWKASTVYALGDLRVTTDGVHSFYYRVTTAGTSGATEPTWNTTTNDGTVVWTRAGAVGLNGWLNTQTKYVGEYTIPTTANALYYTVTVAGITGGTEPTWPTTIGTTVVDGTVTWECTGYYGGFPTSHGTTPVFLDGYLCLVKSGSADIYNSAPDNVFSWNPADFITSEVVPDDTVAITKHNNQIAVFGYDSIEFLYDNGVNQLTGTPFARNQNTAHLIGCYVPHSIKSDLDATYFLGVESGGGDALYKIVGFNIEKVSSSWSDRILNSMSISTSVSSLATISGHTYYIISANITLVYDILEKAWYIWASNPTNNVPYASRYIISDTIGNAYGLGLTSTLGGVFASLNLSYTSDASTAFKWELITTPVINESKRVFYDRLTINADNTAATATVKWTDNDYSTWSSDHNVTLTTRPVLHRLGSSRKRAFSISGSSNHAVRIHSLELDYSEGIV